jgi:hypothetical protein
MICRGTSGVEVRLVAICSVKNGICWVTRLFWTIFTPVKLDSVVFDYEVRCRQFQIRATECGQHQKLPINVFGTKRANVIYYHATLVLLHNCGARVSESHSGPILVPNCIFWQ